MKPFTIDELRRLSSGNKVKLSWKETTKIRYSPVIMKAINNGEAIVYEGWDPTYDEFIFSYCNKRFTAYPEHLSLLNINWFSEDKTTDFTELCKKIREKYKK